jgi:predicted pyridoxine 5'-phosphate oxidase superfamily flavin-nucleotide-binding protein
MGRAFAEIAFTPSVKAAQARYGSRAANEGFERAGDRQEALGELERAFLAERDGFYLASVSETGWPYVQFRGGAAGFLRVLDARTIAFGDFRGNLQYLSVGNIGADGRVALMLMDYANQRRLKIWGWARIVHEVDEPGLIESLAVPGYTARAERAMVVSLDAFDWNCPQHITPRFTEAEVEAAVAPLKAELAALRARLAAAEARAG